jgi:hypothetical protein
MYVNLEECVTKITLAFRVVIKYNDFVLSCTLYYSHMLQEDLFSCNNINSYLLNTVQQSKNVVKHNDTYTLHSYNTMN